MVETSSPTVWRRWLAFELARLRAESGLEQKDVAKALRCTTTKVSYIENAERPVVLRDLDEVLLRLYDVPEDRWPVYMEAAANSRRKGWWESYDADAVPDWFSLYVGLEQGCARIRLYQAQLVPGLLQTEDYAEAIVRRGIAEPTTEQVARRVALRMARQEVLARETSPLRFWGVLDEAALRRVVGSRQIMRTQLTRLVSAVEHGGITLQVLPFDHGAHPGMHGPFQILDFPWPADPGLVYTEHRSGALYLEQAHQIAAHTTAFDHLRALALSPVESVKMIVDIAEEYG